MTDYRDVIGKKSDAWERAQTGVSVGPGNGGVGDGLLYIDNITTPSSDIKSGSGLVSGEVTVINGAATIIRDEDKCQGVAYRAGYEAILHINPSWTDEITTKDCFEYSAVGPYEHKLQYEISAPETSTKDNFSIQFWLEGANSGSTGEQYTEWVTVSPEGEPDPGGDNGEDDDNSSDSNWTMWILNNPGKAAILGVGSMAALKFGLGE